MMNHSQNNHYAIMFAIMIVSGLLSTMNIWVDKIDDMRFSINDLYMILLMCGWMFLFMGLVYQERYIFVIGLVLVIGNIWGIRTQFLVTETQYKLGMIPHHSMAVHISKKLLDKEKDKKIVQFAKNIIKTQDAEIELLKRYF